MNASKIQCQAGLDYPAITCVFVCHDRAGNVLLHRRGSQARDERGCWDTGAGALDHGETFEQAAAREICEEYGATPSELTQLSVRNVLRTSTLGATHWVAITFAAVLRPAEVRLNEPGKFDAIGWFALDEPAPAPAHSQLHHSISAIKKHLAIP